MEELTGKPNLTLQNRPTLAPHLWYYRDIYDELAGSRSYAMDGQPLPIPVTEVLAYCQMFGIRGIEERDTLFKRIRALDAAFRKVMRDRAATKTKS